MNQPSHAILLSRLPGNSGHVAALILKGDQAMKNLILAVSILGSVATPVLAENLCRDQALQRGYIGAIEVLRPCDEPAPQAVSDVAQTIERISAQPASKRMAKKPVPKKPEGDYDVYTQ